MDTPRPYSCRKLDSSEAPLVFPIIQLCGRAMSENEGVSHWLNLTIDHVRHLASTRNLYAVQAAQEIVGTFTTDFEPDHYPREIPWPAGIGKALYVTKLASSKSADYGLLQFCKDWLEEEARRQCCLAIRCDVVAGRRGTMHLFEGLGWQKVEQPIELCDPIGQKYDAQLFERPIASVACDGGEIAPKHPDLSGAP